MTDVYNSEVQLWQEKLADRLRRGSALEVRSQELDGLYHVMASYQTSDGTPNWESYAKFSRSDRAEAAVRTVKRLVAFESAGLN